MIAVPVPESPDSAFPLANRRRTGLLDEAIRWNLTVKPPLGRVRVRPNLKLVYRFLRCPLKLTSPEPFPAIKVRMIKMPIERTS
jgi:hypothetical protein